MMGGEEREEEEKPLRLPDNLASYETRLRKTEAEKEGNVGRGDERVEFCSPPGSSVTGVVRKEAKMAKKKKKRTHRNEDVLHKRARLDAPARSETRSSSSAPQSQTARGQILRLRRRRAVNVFIKCDLASICRPGSSRRPSGAGHQRAG